MRLCTTFGYEFTYLANIRWSPERFGDLSERFRAKTYDAENKIEDIFEKHKNKKWRTTDVHTDEGALEISSPPFGTVKALKDYYTFLNRLAKRNDMIPQHEDVAGGGCHIHTAIPKKYLGHGEPKKLLLYLTNLFRLVQGHHYMNWIFNEYCDTISAQPLFCNYAKSTPIGKILSTGYDIDNLYKRFSRKIRRSFPFADESAEEVAGRFMMNKGNIIIADSIYNSNGDDVWTIEWRMFDMPPDWEGIYDHTDLVNSILLYVNKLTEAGKLLDPVEWSIEHGNNLIREDAWRYKWSHLLRKLKLDEKRYDKYIERNYVPRKELGAFWLREKGYL